MGAGLPVKLLGCVLVLAVTCGCLRSQIRRELAADDPESVRAAVTAASEEFLYAHYEATLPQAERYWEASLLAPPEHEREVEAMVEEKYRDRPLTTACYDFIRSERMAQTIWTLVLWEEGDIKITGMELEMSNAVVSDEANGMDYTVKLGQEGGTVYEVSGNLSFLHDDGVWRIDGVMEYGWSPLPAPVPPPATKPEPSEEE